MIMRESYPFFAFAVGLLDDNEGELSLFKPGTGSRLLDEDITSRDGKLVPWTIGAYLIRARKSAEKVSFGVGFTNPQIQVW